MKRILILAAAVIALGGEAFARLGQTEDQVNALFGKPIDPGKPDRDGITTNMYKNPTGEYLALVQFLNGHSVTEAYSRIDKHKLSEKELSIFLEGNSGGKEWKKKSAQARMGKKRPSRDGMVRNTFGTTDPAHPRQTLTLGYLGRRDLVVLPGCFPVFIARLLR